jgi:hypothetical protein
MHLRGPGRASRPSESMQRVGLRPLQPNANLRAFPPIPENQRMLQMADALVRSLAACRASALHAAKQTADAVWLEGEYYKETSAR